VYFFLVSVIAFPYPSKMLLYSVSTNSG